MKEGIIILDGYQNEFLFVLEFNNKKVKELNPLLREVIDDLFKDIDEDDIIKSWRNHINNQKGDIFIKIKNKVRSLSIKKGSQNSVHAESIDTFINYLRLLKVKESAIKKYLNYHYADNMNSKEYCDSHKEDINVLNKELNTIDIRHFINRFILKGRLSSYIVDGLIYGTPNDFFYINSKDICKIITESKNRSSNSVHIGCLFVQPQNRCLNNNKKYIDKKDYIQIKWYSLFDDIIMYKANKNIKKEL